MCVIVIVILTTFYDINRLWNTGWFMMYNRTIVISKKIQHVMRINNQTLRVIIVENIQSLVFLAGFAAGIFVTFVICFAMKMIIPHKTTQSPDLTSIVQENVNIDKQVVQHTTET
jgi:hypothetical protein